MYLTIFATNWYISFVIFYNMCKDVVISETVKFFKAITSCNARKYDAKQTCGIFK